MAKTPICPYCGGGMEMLGGLFASGNNRYKASYTCLVCRATSPVAESNIRLDAADAALEKALHRASPWHSVKDGLPDSGTFCVVRGYNESGEAHHDIACKIGAGWANWGLNSFKVTHWMPLPEAPKEGDE